ncbi:MAG: hypothetical protein ACR2M8_10115 [Pyrinomonadaceae bacterium]
MASLKLRDVKAFEVIQSNIIQDHLIDQHLHKGVRRHNPLLSALSFICLSRSSSIIADLEA